ncbi:MAG: family 10 glycosylhydrolase [Armatimonadota bacterium]|nr:family 10 glycosylhydrolase [Armatimonadota bacterium]
MRAFATWFVVGALAAACPCHGQPAPPAADAHTLLLAHFDEDFDADHAAGDAAAEANGAELVEDGKWGGAVRLSGGRDLSFASEDNLDMAAGTLMFWFKPDWEPGAPRSHGLLSMRLDGDPPGYLVLSQGWWETSGGAGRMYFVYDNQAYMHCNTQAFANMKQEKLSRWHHVVLTWAEGEPGHNAIYIDGERAAKTVKDCGTVRRPRSRLFVGSDRAQTGGQRWAHGLLDELVILDYAVGDDEIAQAFRAQEPRWEEIQAQRWAWLTEVLEGPEPELPRDEEGRLLESRAILDEGTGWSDPEHIPDIIARIKRAGFNVYIPCIWHGRGTRWAFEGYPSDPRMTQRLEAMEVDPLELLIEQCHAEGIEVHPWFCVVKREGDVLPQFVEEGTPSGFFDAHRPQFRDFIVGLMIQVIREYEVDGVNLDFIRTGGLCTGPLCRQEYREQFGAELTEDVQRRTEEGWPNPNIVEWQNQAISDIVQRVAEGGREIRPGLIVSVDGHPRPPGEPPDANGRNELPWVEAGWVDVVYNMDYGRMLSWLRMDATRAACDPPAAIVELCGNYERTDEGQVVPREGKLVAKHIDFCRRKWPGNGVALYIWSMLSDEQIQALRAGPFAEDAVPHWIRSAGEARE